MGDTKGALAALVPACAWNPGNLSECDMFLELAQEEIPESVKEVRECLRDRFIPDNPEIKTRRALKNAYTKLRQDGLIDSDDILHIADNLKPRDSFKKVINKFKSFIT